MLNHLARVAILLTTFAASMSWAFADKRVALVIGNGVYPQAARLLNPANDAQDMADTLKLLGFEVILQLNTDKPTFSKALADFSRASTGADVALFYYAGHGMQYQGRNYLMPIDAELKDEISLQYELVALDEIRLALDRSAGPRIMILDACRNNPLAAQFARSLSSPTRAVGTTRGLARVEQARGSVVVYSTQANEVAADGGSRNSPFTGALLESLREPGLEISAMFRKVAARVYEQTNGQQIPELSMSLLSDLYLNRNASAAQIWGQVREGNDPAALRDFLNRFPTSFYAADARTRLEMLESADRERELRNRLAALESERQNAEVELSSQTAAAGRAKASAAEVAAKDRQIAEIEESRRRIEARLAELQQRMQAVAIQANEEAAARQVQRQKIAAVDPETPAAIDERKLAVAIESELRRLGCYAAATSADWQSPAFRKAVADFAVRTHLAKVPEQPTPELLDDLKARGGPVCTPTCGPREREDQGRCVARTCGAGEVLSGSGECVPRVERKSASAVARPRRSEPSGAPARGGRSGCFNFNGRQFCE
jgi:uncharacterized caspase-like protein